MGRAPRALFFSNASGLEGSTRASEVGTAPNGVKVVLRAPNPNADSLKALNQNGFYGHGPVVNDFDSRAIGPLLRIGADVIGGLVGGQSNSDDSDNEKREVINIPKNLLKSLASGSATPAQKRSVDQDARAELELVLRSILNELD